MTSEIDDGLQELTLDDLEHFGLPAPPQWSDLPPAPPSDGAASEGEGASVPPLPPPPLPAEGVVVLGGAGGEGATQATATTPSSPFSQPPSSSPPPSSSLPAYSMSSALEGIVDLSAAAMRDIDELEAAAAKHLAKGPDALQPLERRLGATWFAMRGFDNKMMAVGGPLRK